MPDIEAQSGSGGYAGEGGKQMRLPKQNINNEWFVGTIEVIKKMDFVLSTLTRVDDPRPKIMARQIINRILDDKTRYTLLDAFDKKLEEINEMKDKDGKPASSTDQWEERIRISQDFVGEVNGYLDEALALHKGQEIGEV
jgi:hypothetical protein